MSFELVYWILMLIWLIFGFFNRFNPGALGTWGPFGGDLLIFVLFLLLGWHVFGTPVHP